MLLCMQVFNDCAVRTVQSVPCVDAASKSLIHLPLELVESFSLTVVGFGKGSECHGLVQQLPYVGCNMKSPE